jgi:hypothetical protein
LGSIARLLIIASQSVGPGELGSLGGFVAVRGPSIEGLRRLASTRLP